jgi:hypothetical protein
LQILNLLDLLVRVRVRALELSPSVHVERLLELIVKELALLLLLEILLLQKEDLFLQVLDAGRLTGRNGQFLLSLSNLTLQALDVLDAVLVVDLTLLEGRLLDLDLLVKQLQLFVSLDELCAEDVTLVDDHLIVLALLLLLSLRLEDDVFKARDVSILRLDHLFTRGNVVRDLLDVLSELRVLVLQLILLLRGAND